MLIRLSATEHRLIVTESARHGMTRSDYVRSLVRTASGFGIPQRPLDVRPPDVVKR